MRVILLAIVVLIGTNLALKSIDKVDKIQQDKMQQLCQIDPSYCTTKWIIIHQNSIKKSLRITSIDSQNSTLFLPIMNKHQMQRLQEQSINLLELIEDVSEQFCDDNLMSGEQFYVMMKALVDCKLKEFPLDFEQLEEDIYDE